MTDAERDKAFKAAQREAMKDRTALLASTRDEVVRLLKVAQEQIKATLAGTPSDYHSWYLPQLQADIQRTLTSLGEQSAAVLSSAATQAREKGAESVTAPLEAGGIRLAGQIPSLDTKQLMAMRTFMTDRIKDVSTQAATKINSELGLVMIGAQTPGDAITRVSSILGDESRARATTIVRTELGRAYAVAAHEKRLQAGEKVPGLKKQWRRSGKIHSRTNHDLVDGQVQDLDQPFILHGKTGALVKMKHPHDPAAPASETINCGCVELSYMASWDMSTPGKKPFSEDELRLNPAKRDQYEAKTIAQIERAKLRSVLKGLETQIAVGAVEQAFFIDRAGNTILSKTGSESSVSFTAGELAQIKDSTSLHNHPGIASFSDTDVAFASANELAELRVVDDAYSYSMRPPVGGWDALLWENEIKPLYDDAVATLMGEFWDKLSAGTMSEPELRENFQHDVWTRVNQQLDLHYRRKARTDK